MKLETYAGDHIFDVLQKAVDASKTHGEDVVFDFNGKEVAVLYGDDFGKAKERAEKTLGYKIQSREDDAIEAGERLRAMEQETKEAIENAGVMTEQQMREAKVPWPKTLDELNEYINSLTERPHDYGTCVYAMSMASVATFYYVSSKLGCTGFQASCADMDFLRHTRNFEWGQILNFENLLYPQYVNGEKFPTAQKVINDNKEEFAKRAKEKLAEESMAHPEVKKHWEYLASLA